MNGWLLPRTAGHLHAERTHHRAGERGDVDDRVGLGLDAEGQTVGEHQPAFGIGVEDLGGLAVAEGQHIAERSTALPDGMLSVHIR